VGLSVVIALVAPPWPPAGSPNHAITAYFALHRMPFLIGNYLAAVAVIPGVIQVAALAALARSRDEGGWLWLAMFGATLIAHASGVVVLANYQALAFLATSATDSGTAVVISELANVGFGFFVIALAAAQ